MKVSYGIRLIEFLIFWFLNNLLSASFTYCFRQSSNFLSMSYGSEREELPSAPRTILKLPSSIESATCPETKTMRNTSRGTLVSLEFFTFFASLAKIMKLETETLSRVSFIKMEMSDLVVTLEWVDAKRCFIG